ncbi:c-type cytochrome [Mesorhizobium sp. WSM2239]|uniref:C-type cytochrome n=2 Tax=unclassified Mesorhizobium TaxID=325217 RepID=A0AAU8D493_9HYPH
MIRFHWRQIAIALAILPFAAVFVAWIGFFNIGASTGHWKITEWFLHFAMRSAIRTYSLAVEVPERLPVEGIQPAAGHFARGCAICHGAPGEPRSPAVLQMLPRPPDLASVVGSWSDAELFRIVKYGVRFTGMPAWPTQERDDEVWAMVAFLRSLPQMDARTYRELAFGGEGAAVTLANGFETALADCARCHGRDGRGRSAGVPIISGQREEYLRASLEAFAEGKRPSGVMELAAVETDPRLFADLARHFASQPPVSASAAGSSDAARGREIAERGIPEKRVPACLSCHGGAPRNPVYPKLDGQHADYLKMQLRLFAEGKRGGTPYAHLMEKTARSLEARDIEDLAAYFSSVK